MQTFARQLLSGSTSGRPIPVAATSTPGTLIHAAVSGAASFDEVYLWATNTTGSAVTITVEWGGVTDPGDHLVKGYSLPANSDPVQISAGLNLNGGLEVRAFASAAGVNITGFVSRIA